MKPHWLSGIVPASLRRGGALALGMIVAGSLLHAQTLLIHLPLDGTANDASGNGNHGVNNGARPIANRFGNAQSALLFDGVDDYIRIPDNAGIRPRMVTVSMWVKF